MTYKTLITRMFFLTAVADGKFDQKEIEMGHRLAKFEGIDDKDFQAELESLKMKDQGEMLHEAMTVLKTFSHDEQVRVVAWMCVVANADGFMDRSEWQMIYQIYHKELALPLHDIFKVQKQLNRYIWETSSMVGL